MYSHTLINWWVFFGYDSPLTSLRISNEKSHFNLTLVICFNLNWVVSHEVYIYLMWTAHQSWNNLVSGGVSWHACTLQMRHFTPIEGDGVWGWSGEMPVSVLNPSTSKWLFTENSGWWRANLLKMHVSLLSFSQSLAFSHWLFWFLHC